MAQSKNGAKGTSEDGKYQKGYGGWQFVRHNMSADEKNALEQYTPSDAELWDAIERLVDSDYKLSIAHDEYNQCVSAQLACRNKKHADYKLILSGRAPDAYNAVRVVLFKHIVLLHGDWKAFHEREVERDVWG